MIDLTTDGLGCEKYLSRSISCEVERVNRRTALIDENQNCSSDPNRLEEYISMAYIGIKIAEEEKMRTNSKS